MHNEKLISNDENESVINIGVERQQVEILMEKQGATVSGGDQQLNKTVLLEGEHLILFSLM